MYIFAFSIIDRVFPQNELKEVSSTKFIKMTFVFWVWKNTYFYNSRDKVGKNFIEKAAREGTSSQKKKWTRPFLKLGEGTSSNSVWKKSLSFSYSIEKWFSYIFHTLLSHLIVCSLFFQFFFHQPTFSDRDRDLKW
jgi:hypothetical protein